jgi:hypothetical protein
LWGGFARAIHRNEATGLKPLHGLSGGFLSRVNYLCGTIVLAWRVAHAKPLYAYAIISVDFSIDAEMFYAELPTRLCGRRVLFFTVNLLEFRRAGHVTLFVEFL